MKIRILIKEMRLHHSIKNLLVFLPLMCSGHLFEYGKGLKCLIGFFIFCFVSSAIYIINDIKDIEKDRLHPTKCKRPIAAGKLSVKYAAFFSVVFLIIPLLFNFLVFNFNSVLLLCSYLIINLGYSFGLKKIPLLDVAILVSGFLIRVLFGSVITDIKISNWLYLFVISVAFYLGLGKRKNELMKQGESETRDVIKKYPLSFLNGNMYVFMTLIFVFYALWTVDTNTIKVYNTENLIWTVPFIIMIFMKYSLTIEGKSDGDPVEVLLHDKILIILCLLYMLLMIILLYF